MSEIEESAKAVQEVAKTTGTAIDAVAGAGRFLARILGGSLEEAGGMLHDTVRFHRAVRALRLEKRFEEKRAEIGIAKPLAPIDMNVALPLIEAASLQEDDDIQDLYASLLVNATNPDSGVEVRRMFVSILQDFGPLEAKLLDMLCKAEPNKDGAGIWTAALPDAYAGDKPDPSQMLPSKPVQVALWNLTRLGCIEPAGTYGGGSTIAAVTVTGLGVALHDACTVTVKAENVHIAAPASEQPAPDLGWDAIRTGGPRAFQ